MPDALRGRMMATYSFVVMGLSQVVGSLIAGSLAHVFNASVAIGLGGAGLLVCSFFVFVKRPELRHL